MKLKSKNSGRWNLEEEEEEKEEQDGEGEEDSSFLLPPAFSHTIGSKNSSFPSSERERDTWAEKFLQRVFRGGNGMSSSQKKWRV